MNGTINRNSIALVHFCVNQILESNHLLNTFCPEVKASHGRTLLLMHETLSYYYDHNH